MMQVKTQKKILPVGSLSEGTLKEEDIWDSLIYAFEQVAPRRAKQLKKDWEATQGAPNWRCELLDELQQEMSDYAPPFCYVGAHEGDGASIGVWLSHLSLEEGIREGEVYKQVNCEACRGTGGWILGRIAREGGLAGVCRNCRGKGYRMPKTAKFRMTVSDHGNVSLYYRNGKEVWGIV